jgi:hypothetical protein
VRQLSSLDGRCIAHPRPDVTARCAATGPRLRLAVLGAVALLLPLVWWAVTAAAIRYCATVEAVVVTHRHLLYRSVGLPVPCGTDEEPEQGHMLTAYLTRFAAVPEAALSWPDPT